MVRACHDIIKNGAVSTKAHVIVQLFYQSPQVLFAIRDEMEQEFVSVSRLSSVWSFRGVLPICWPARLGRGLWGKGGSSALSLWAVKPPKRDRPRSNPRARAGTKPKPTGKQFQERLRRRQWENNARRRLRYQVRVQNGGAPAPPPVPPPAALEFMDLDALFAPSSPDEAASHDEVV